MEASRERILYGFVLGFGLSVAFASYVTLPTQLLIFLVAITALLSISYAALRLPQILLIGVFFLGLSIGFWRYQIVDANTLDPALAARINTEVEVSGIVATDPVRTDSSLHFALDLSSLAAGSTSEAVSDRILVYADFYPEVSYGDALTVSGTLERPENFTTNTGREFDYVSYLEKDGIYATMSYPTITILSSGGGNVFVRNLFALKHSIFSSIERMLPEPHAGLLEGVLLGRKGVLGEAYDALFRTAGLSHIVVLSGYNITILAEMVIILLSFFSRKISLPVSVLAILLFTIMTGASATTIRAGIMALLLLFARSTGRTYSASRALLAAGMIMVFLNPKLLVFDVSFQLSFLATLGILYLAPWIESRLQFITSRFGLRDVIATTLSAQVAVLPVLVASIGNVSLVSLPANALILPIVPIFMLIGFLLVFFGSISPFLAIPFSFTAYLLAEYVLRMVRFFASIPHASVSVPYVPLWAFGILFIFTFYVLRFLTAYISRKACFSYE